MIANPKIAGFDEAPDEPAEPALSARAGQEACQDLQPTLHGPGMTASFEADALHKMWAGPRNQKVSSRKAGLFARVKKIGADDVKGLFGYKDDGARNTTALRAAPIISGVP